MKSIYVIPLLLLAAALGSCADASFTPVDTPPVVNSDLWFTSEPIGHIQGRIHDDHNGGKNGLPATATIVVAWEMPNDPGRLLYAYGSGTITKYGPYNFNYDITLRDTLPIFILKNKDTNNAIAACHIFLLADANIHEGDTIRQSDDWNTYKIIGSLNEISVIFSKGSPTLAGRKIPGNPIGFNSFIATRWDANGSVIDFFPADPSRIEIEVDDDGHDCKQKTPLWLQ